MTTFKAADSSIDRALPENFKGSNGHGGSDQSALSDQPSVKV